LGQERRVSCEYLSVDFDWKFSRFAKMALLQVRVCEKLREVLVHAGGKSIGMPAKLESGFPKMTVHRAGREEIDAAWQIVSEYYDAAEVVARDSKEEFAANYFGDGAGVWLACAVGKTVGCIALRRLASIQDAGEVKRLYVRLEFRGHGIAAGLYEALEAYAAEIGYQFLYLDTAAGMRAAQHFYKLLGYQDCPRYNDNPQASLFMRKKLKTLDK
jgi:GNAT superfamily N-acetyltransferase